MEGAWSPLQHLLPVGNGPNSPAPSPWASDTLEEGEGPPQTLTTQSRAFLLVSDIHSAAALILLSKRILGEGHIPHGNGVPRALLS